MMKYYQRHEWKTSVLPLAMTIKGIKYKVAGWRMKRNLKTVKEFMLIPLVEDDNPMIIEVTQRRNHA